MSKKYVLFDFDGTISTLRHGWEGVMMPYFMEVLGVTPDDEDKVRMIAEYIDQSTGIQTVYQMQWLKDKAAELGLTPILDVWDYKKGYNDRILRHVQERKALIQSGAKKREDFLMRGSERFLGALRSAGCELYVASGTDHRDVCKEVEFLGLTSYFERITGAPEDKFGCSKDQVMRELIEGSGIGGDQLTVIGDGKVEIALAKQFGAGAIGIASDEEKLTGINEQKKKRLQNAGADLIIGDFEDSEGLVKWILAR